MTHSRAVALAGAALLLGSVAASAASQIDAIARTSPEKRQSGGN